MVKNPEFQFAKPLEGEEEYGLASPLDRLAAVIVDGLVLLPLVQVIQSPFKRELIRSLAFENSEATMTWRALNFVTLIFVFWIYNTFSIYFFSQTIGKKIFNIKVISFRSEVSLLSSAVRSFCFFFELLFLGLPLAALFSHPWRRPFHDRVGDTIVVSTKKPVSSPSIEERRRAYIFISCALFSFSLSSLFYFYISMGENMRVSLAEDEVKRCNKFVEGVEPSVSHAIKNFSIKRIDSECLKKVAKKALWDNREKDLANLANSLAHHEQESLSLSYLNQVCENNSAGRACRFSKWVRKNPIEKSLNIDEIKNIMAENKVEDFYRIYFISALQVHGRHKEVQDLVASVQDPQGIREFLSLASFKSLLWQNKWEAAYWVYKTNGVAEDSFIEFIEEAEESPKISEKQLLSSLEYFYPKLKASQPGERGLASTSPIPVRVRGLWMRLRERK